MLDFIETGADGWRSADGLHCNRLAAAIQVSGKDAAEVAAASGYRRMDWFCRQVELGRTISVDKRRQIAEALALPVGDLFGVHRRWEGRNENGEVNCIRSLCARMEIRHSALARDAGYSASQMSRIINGTERASAAGRARIAACLGVDESDVWRMEDDAG